MLSATDHERQTVFAYMSSGSALRISWPSILNLNSGTVGRPRV
jgi:hypothetical protein